MSADDPSPKWAWLIAGLMILATTTHCWLKTEYKYEKRQTKTTEVWYCGGACAYADRHEPGRVAELPVGRDGDREQAIRKYLEARNPGIAWISPVVVRLSGVYGTDPLLVTAVGALESGVFRHCVGGNCWGHRGATGYLEYASLEEGIDRAARLFGTARYAGKSIAQIGPIYAEDPNWGVKVTTIYNEIKSYE